ncbi:MAG TPA: hypothetical protein VJH22_03510 [Candidatus Nanoarchaeia archaeon]|nr:hypothetical protein [Candidatus Nanoarchaeia archaeon]
MASKKTFQIWYDREGDFLEIRTSMGERGVFESIGNDCFKRLDEKTGDVVGLAIFNFSKQFSDRKEINIPAQISIKMSKKEKSASKA